MSFEVSRSGDHPNRVTIISQKPVDEDDTKRIAALLAAAFPNRCATAHYGTDNYHFHSVDEVERTE